MQYDNFLINTYLGCLDPENFHSFRKLELDEKARDIIDRYRTINARYPASELEKSGSVPPELFDDLKAIGFFGLNIPARYGGVGLKVWQYLKVVEDIVAENMSLGFTALAHLSIGVKGIILFGTEAQKKQYLPQAAAGDMIFSYALTEPKTGSDARNIDTIATLSDDGQSYVLNGQKTYITNANYAGGLTVFAQMDPAKPGTMGAFIIETDWDGVRIGKDMPKMGLKASSTAAVQLKNVHVPRQNLLGQPGDGFKIAMTILNYGRLALGAGSAGMIKQSLKDMTRRSALRTQFGIPINQFELVQEKMVKARVNGTVAAAMTAFAAGALDRDPLAAVAIESSHCKLFGTTRAWDTLYDALQVAGGAGYLSTQPYEKRMRDFRVTTIFEGTTEIHSIYPALFVIRAISKKMLAQHRDRISQVLFLIKGLLGTTASNLRFAHPDMNKAMRFVRSSARRIRFLVHAGMLLHGKKIVQREFFLRRISTLSIYMFGILAVLARLEADRKAGRRIDETLEVLGYFLEEARGERRINFRLFTSRKEKYHHRIIEDLFGTYAAAAAAGQGTRPQEEPVYATDDR